MPREILHPVPRMIQNLDIRGSEDPDFRQIEILDIHNFWTSCIPDFRQSDFRISGTPNPDIRIFAFLDLGFFGTSKTLVQKASDVDFAYMEFP